MKLLTIKQPWASLICLGIKDVENRTWKHNSLIGEKLLIMSSKTDVKLANTNASWREEYLRLVQNGTIPSLKLLPKGKIIGYVDVVAIEKESESIWSADASHFKYVLANAHLFKTPIDGIRGWLKPIVEFIFRKHHGLNMNSQFLKYILYSTNNYIFSPFGLLRFLQDRESLFRAVLHDKFSYQTL